LHDFPIGAQPPTRGGDIAKITGRCIKGCSAQLRRKAAIEAMVALDMFVELRLENLCNILINSDNKNAARSSFVGAASCE
jgi:hypothetical protein